MTGLGDFYITQNPPPDRLQMKGSYHAQFKFLYFTFKNSNHGTQKKTTELIHRNCLAFFETGWTWTIRWTKKFGEACVTATFWISRGEMWEPFHQAAYLVGYLSGNSKADEILKAGWVIGGLRRTGLPPGVRCAEREPKPQKRSFQRSFEDNDPSVVNSPCDPYPAMKMEKNFKSKIDQILKTPETRAS